MRFKGLPDNRWGRAAIEAAFYTLLAFILSFLIAAPVGFSVLSVFTNLEKNDFKISDLYDQLADQRAVRTLDPDVVIVDIGNADREGIAEILEIISFCEPKAVGLDVLFDEPLYTETDDRLIKAMASIPALVLPVGLDKRPDGNFNIVERSFMADSLPGAIAAATNLTNEFSGGTVREMTIRFPLANGDTLPSFPAAIASFYPEAEKRIKERNRELEVISYPSREFKVIDPNELYDRAEELEGKAVLIGAMTDATDIHATPLRQAMPGLEIHASALSTLIRQDYPKLFSDFMPDWIPALIVTFLLLFIREIAPAGIRGIFTRVMQVLIIILSVRIGYQLYVEKRIIFNFSYTLLMVVFAFFGIDIWSSVKYIAGHATRAVKRKLTKRKTNMT